MTDDTYEKMKEIRDEVVNLKSSSLYAYRTENNYLPVIGEGSHSADVVFVGEAPGRNEAKTGRPFCGAAGKILDTLLESISLDRNDIYITNIVKDRPPKNRDPLPEEIELYAPFLGRQLDIIKPKIVVTLGRFSMNYMIQRYGSVSNIEPIGAAHGKVFKIMLPYGETTLIPQYHPAATIYNRELIKTLTKDFTVIKEMLDSINTA
jgi:DNA polymerase